jgi:4-hydroxy-tetrahydrodipicolinate synthase
VAVVAGTTAEGLRTCIEYTRNAKAAGASAVMISPPRMAKLNSEAVVRHFAAVADAVDIELVVQDFPPITGFTMEPALLARIAREIPRARTIKLEDPPTPFKTSRILEATKDIEVRIFGGLGGVFLLEELMAGATGAMTGFAYPEILVEIVRAFRAGEIDKAADVFYRSVPLMRFEFQEGIGMAIRKEVLRRRGALASSAIRAPGAKLDAATTAALDRVLRWVNA